MNEPEDPLTEEMVDELFAPLRSVDCPAEVQRSNRLAIELALARRLSIPWWHRSVAVPLPLAIAASLLLMATAGALLWPAVSGSAVTMDSPAFRGNVAATANEESPVWNLSRSYILSIDSLSRMENSFRADVKEEQNDS
jgi:hypothetical protein